MENKLNGKHRTREQIDLCEAQTWSNHCQIRSRNWSTCVCQPATQEITQSTYDMYALPHEVGAQERGSLYVYLV